MKQFIKASVEKKNDRLVFVASDETVDRHGESIPVETWDLKNFKKNPILLLDHNASVENIVGKAKKVWIEGKKLMIEPILHDITEKSRMLKEMIDEGIVSTVSVGFLQRMNKKEEWTNELLEVSFVAVPANPNAKIQKALEAKVKEEEIVKIKEFIGQDDIREQLEELKEITKGIESVIGSLTAAPTSKVRKIKLIKARKAVKTADAYLGGLNKALRAKLRQEEVD